MGSKALLLGAGLSNPCLTHEVRAFLRSRGHGPANQEVITENNQRSTTDVLTGDQGAF